MVILKSLLFNGCTNLSFGLTTKIDTQTDSPFGFNLSLTAGDDNKRVERDRQRFFRELRLENNVATQHQIHSDKIVFVDCPGDQGESDAMITDKPGLGLAISTADCVSIFLYEPKRKIIAGVHSGWKGTSLKILEKTIIKLEEEFHANLKEIICYIGPSISQKNYEVGEDVAKYFDEKYLSPKGAKFLLDVAKINYDILRKFEVRKENIQISSLCSYDWKSLFHSYRRDGSLSGRSLGVLAMKGNS
ncbi:MAG: peptidoglycan editing factor PgeF [Ignavibacteria bacterium]|nr:peptidoglycan editing factor PgeF [Ignavibacteria bacterium]